jgi:hypothetical protein
MRFRFRLFPAPGVCRMSPLVLRCQELSKMNHHCPPPAIHFLGACNGARIRSFSQTDLNALLSDGFAMTWKEGNVRHSGERKVGAEKPTATQERCANRRASYS